MTKRKVYTIWEKHACIVSLKTVAAHPSLHKYTHTQPKFWRTPPPHKNMKIGGRSHFTIMNVLAYRLCAPLLQEKTQTNSELQD